MNTRKYRAAEAMLWDNVGCKPVETHIALAGTNTRVRIQEVGEGEPVLFIHGGPNAGATWAPLVAHLEGYRCLLVDRPGTGLSERFVMSAQGLPEIGARFVGDVLNGLGIDRAHVVASSFGGHLALRSAAAQPERFGRMVQMAAPAVVPGQVFPPFMNSLRSSLVRGLMNAFPPSGKLNRLIMRQMGHGASLDSGRFPEVFFDWYLSLGRDTDTVRNDVRMIGAEILPNLDSLTLTPELLGSVEVPTLFLWGADDGFGGEDNARFVSGMIPHVDLVMIPDVGHLPWLDAPELIAAHTSQYLARSSVGSIERQNQTSGAER